MPAPNETVGAVLLSTTTPDGMATLRLLRFTFPNVRIIAVVASPGGASEATTAGATSAVVAPGTTADLTAQLAQTLKSTLGR